VRRGAALWIKGVVLVSNRLARSSWLGTVSIALLVALVALPPAVDAEAPARAREGLIFQSSFEHGDLRGFYWHNNKPEVVGPPHPVRAGERSMRTYLHRYESDNPYRTEVIVGSSQDAPEGTERPMLMDVGAEYWIGFSIYIPPDFVPDTFRLSDVVFQMQATPDPGEDYRSPVFALEIDEAEWRIIVRYDVRRESPPGNEFTDNETIARPALGAAVGAWTDWVIHVRWAYDDTGYLQVWRNGEQVLERQGPNCANDEHGPHVAIGLYKWPWRPNAPANWEHRTDNRLYYYDELRIGGAGASYADVAPGDGPPAGPAQAAAPTPEPTATPEPTPVSTPAPTPTPLPQDILSRLRRLFEALWGALVR
jgi:hypothetical protein